MSFDFREHSGLLPIFTRTSPQPNNSNYATGRRNRTTKFAQFSTKETCKLCDCDSKIRLLPERVRMACLRLITSIGVSKNSTVLFDGAGSDERDRTSPADQVTFWRNVYGFDCRTEYARWPNGNRRSRIRLLASSAIRKFCLNSSTPTNSL
jgi:hypothetical protein